MINLSSFPLRLYKPGTKFFYEQQNQPLSDLYNMIEALVVVLNAVEEEITNARGDAGSLDARLARFLTAWGGVKAAHLNDPFDPADPLVNESTKLINSDATVVVDGNRMAGLRDKYMHSISAHADSAEHVRMTTDERVKLDGIERRATRTVLRVDNAKYPVPSGDIELISGQGTRLQQIGQRIFFHSLIPLEFLHKHIYAERPSPSPAISNDPTTGTQIAAVIDGTVRTFVTSQPYMPGSLRVFVNGARVDKIRFFETNPEAGVFEFRQFVDQSELPDEGRGDSLRVDYDVPIGLSSEIAAPTYTAVENFKGVGNAIPTLALSTWKLRSPAVIESPLHQLYMNGIQYRMRPFPFDAADPTEYDWQFGNINGTVDNLTIVRQSNGILTSEYVIWLNPNVTIQPEDQITIYYVT